MTLAGKALRAVVAACISCLPGARVAAGDGVQVSIYAAGQRTEIPAQRHLGSGLLELCEAQVRGADGVLRLAVSSDTIAAQRRGALTLELRYPAARRFELATLGRTIAASRLLIPLSGELSGPVTTIFHGDPDYGSGPLRNTRGSGEIRQIVEALQRTGR